MAKTIKKAARQGAASISTSTGSNHSDVDVKVQRRKVLAMLRRRARTTIELRAAGVLMPAARVFELRALGHAIQTARVVRVDSEGYRHTGVALYSLSEAA
jgi:deoxyribose-phosphate aldolase